MTSDLAPDTTAQLHGSCKVHALMVQCCLGGMTRTYTILNCNGFNVLMIGVYDAFRAGLLNFGRGGWWPAYQGYHQTVLVSGTGNGDPYYRDK